MEILMLRSDVDRGNDTVYQHVIRRHWYTGTLPDVCYKSSGLKGLYPWLIDPIQKKIPRTVWLTFRGQWRNEQTIWGGGRGIQGRSPGSSVVLGIELRSDKHYFDILFATLAGH